MSRDSQFRNRGMLINDPAAAPGHNGFTLGGTLSTVERQSQVVLVENGDKYGFHGGELRAHLLQRGKQRGMGAFDFWVNPFTGQVMNPRTVRRLRFKLQLHGALRYVRVADGVVFDEGSDVHAASVDYFIS